MRVLFFIWKMRAADRLLCAAPTIGGSKPPPYENLATAMPPLKREGDRRYAVAGLHRLPYLFHKPVDGVGQFGEHFRIAVLHGVNDTVLQVVLEDHLAGAV